MRRDLPEDVHTTKAWQEHQDMFRGASFRLRDGIYYAAVLSICVHYSANKTLLFRRPRRLSSHLKLLFVSGGAFGRRCFIILFTPRQEHTRDWMDTKVETSCIKTGTNKRKREREPQANVETEGTR